MRKIIAFLSDNEVGELAFEEDLAAALRAGITVPRVLLDTIGAVFISASRSATDFLLRRQ